MHHHITFNESLLASLYLSNPFMYLEMSFLMRADLMLGLWRSHR